MKLFTRTFLLIILLIIFQSSLTIAVVISLIRQNNNDDVVENLHFESRVFYNEFNSWKSAIWKRIIFLKDDPGLNSLLESLDRSFDPAEIEKYISEILSNSGMDMLCLKAKDKQFYHPIALSETRIALEQNRMEIKTDHPAIRMILDNNVIYIVGMIRIGEMDLFLIKKVNRDFCLQMSTDYHSNLMFYNNGAYINGSLVKTEVIESLNFRMPEVAYTKFKVDDAEVTVQKVGTIETLNKKSDLLLVTYLSTVPYNDYLVSVEKILFSVSFIGALLTGLLSYFISRSMTMPLLHLTSAMKKIQNGDYKTTYNYMSINEIGSLVSGFNEMAGHLYADKIAMGKYIEEITYLKNYNETIVQSIRVGLAIINSSFLIEKANSFFYQFLNIQETTGYPDLGSCHLITDEVLKGIGDILQGKLEFYSKTLRSDSDLSRVFDIKLYPFKKIEDHRDISEGCVLLIDDVSKKSELDEKIFLAEKLSTISMLSAGVAHEINNPLSSILSNVQNVKSAELNEDLMGNLRWIEQETLRIAQIVRNLLDFSSPGAQSGSNTSVNQIVEQVLNLIKYTAGFDISIRKNLEIDLENATICDDELKQVIINLVLNSIQAMPDGGEICLTTRRSERENNILIVIEDTGSGIDEKNIKRIFDPFFTTKENGSGTGLGLSVVYGIVSKYCGSIDVKSTPGKGTAVYLNIPATGGINERV